MASNPKDPGEDRGDAEDAPVTEPPPAPTPDAARLQRTASSTRLLASEILELLRKKSSRPPELTEEEKTEEEKAEEKKKPE